MYTLEKIDKHLIKSSHQNLDVFFVAAACLINNEGVAYHAGLIIHCDEGYFLFHYTSTEILLDDIQESEWCFHKAFDFITPDMCGTFLGHCKIIQENANPQYGFFYSGSYYIDGTYYNDLAIPEYMTCVGFCINVVKGFIEADEYFEYTDWTNARAPQSYIDSFVAQIQEVSPDVSAESIAENIRRISPPEYIASAYLTKLPIRKVDIDAIIHLVLDSIRLKIQVN